MCTVTWLRQDGGFDLFCNRDEKVSRTEAEVPGMYRRGGVRFLAPLDGDFGGTWIGANEYGLAACLLNGSVSVPEGPVSPSSSRGRVLPELLSSRSITEFAGRFSDLDLGRFAPFTLVALEPDQPAAVLEWSGGNRWIMLYGDPYLPVCSSSFDRDGVRKARRQDFRRRVRTAGKLDTDVLLSFHSSHAGGPSPYSPCMHRPDAETVSFSRVSVTPEAVEFVYSPLPPCRMARRVRQVLPLRT